MAAPYKAAWKPSDSGPLHRGNARTGSPLAQPSGSHHKAPVQWSVPHCKVTWKRGVQQAHCAVTSPKTCGFEAITRHKRSLSSCALRNSLFHQSAHSNLVYLVAFIKSLHSCGDHCLYHRNKRSNVQHIGHVQTRLCRTTLNYPIEPNVALQQKHSKL